MPKQKDAHIVCFAYTALGNIVK